jgi:hypothetical protein
MSAAIIAVLLACPINGRTGYVRIASVLAPYDGSIVPALDIEL